MLRKSSNLLSRLIWTKSQNGLRCFSATQNYTQNQNIIKSVEQNNENDSQVQKSDDRYNRKVKTIYAKGKKPQRQPLIKNFFCGKVDTELLAYPEVVPREEMENLEKDIKISNNFFQQNVNSEDILAKKHIPINVITKLKESLAFGTNVPHLFGGRGYGTTENCYFSESETADINVATTLNSHRLVVQVISECGSEEQKTKFLPLLATGKLEYFFNLF